MANEIRVRQNALGGYIEDSPLTSTATSMQSAALAAMVAIGSTQHMAITLDPDAKDGEPEIAYVTAHAASSTAVTLLRGQETTTARQHKQDIRWMHGPTLKDFESGIAPLTTFASGADLSLSATSITAIELLTTTVVFPNSGYLAVTGALNFIGTFSGAADVMFRIQAGGVTGDYIAAVAATGSDTFSIPISGFVQGLPGASVVMKLMYSVTSGTIQFQPTTRGGAVYGNRWTFVPVGV